MARRIIRSSSYDDDVGVDDIRHDGSDMKRYTESTECERKRKRKRGRQKDSEYDEDGNETETNSVKLRRTLCSIIMSTMDFDESGHKLLQIKFKPNQEMELCIILLECCCHERTYRSYYGLLGQRLCMTNEVHKKHFEKCFRQQYFMIHQFDTNKLAIVAKFFAHLLSTDALSWHVLGYIQLTEEDTTVSSRLFLKIFFRELGEQLGIRLLNKRLQDPTMQESFESIFPKVCLKNMKFSINFFTSIGLGRIVENLRQYYEDNVAEVEAKLELHRH